MIIKLVTNINFWSALCGLLGTILIFFFGLPPKIDQDGHSYFILEQDNEKEKHTAQIYKKMSYFGLLFIGLSFLLQIINLIAK